MRAPETCALGALPPSLRGVSCWEYLCYWCCEEDLMMPRPSSGPGGRGWGHVWAGQGGPLALGRIVISLTCSAPPPGGPPPHPALPSQSSASHGPPGLWECLLGRLPALQKNWRPWALRCLGVGLCWRGQAAKCERPAPDSSACCPGNGATVSIDLGAKES